MDGFSVLVAVRCAGCFVVFYVCESDYRGQVYGSEGCQRGGRRSANARHQASPEGRLDHRDAMRVHRDRKRAGATTVTDTRSANLAPEASSCVRDDASASAMVAHAVAAESTCDATTESDDAASAPTDPVARDGGPRRGDGPSDDESPARCGGAPGRPASAVPTGEVFCAVCRRPGVFIRDAEDRRTRLWNANRARRRRGRVPRPPSAEPPAPPPRRRR